MYVYHALINALSAHTIHINLSIIFSTHVEHSPTETIYIRYYMETHAHTQWLITQCFTPSQPWRLHQGKLRQGKPQSRTTHDSVPENALPLLRELRVHSLLLRLQGFVLGLSLLQVCGQLLMVRAVGLGLQLLLNGLHLRAQLLQLACNRHGPPKVSR